ncbi:flagellar filament capping protein FliD [Modestobacter marinus]|uniref:Flagellar hook-associated protein 2 n=2 Tax=Modestobacter marinus TaxID=477641 RepID=A0ABQ2FZA6_9ACTN|nr:flagellar hook-associated protein 2 [Modestobacter marinus]
MAGMSVSTGLISGIDYKTMISQLMQVEANPQTLLKQQLSATNADAAAYRAVNTRFEALRTAAAALTADTAWTATKASSSDPSVTATAAAGATAGSLSFTVTSLATTHSVYSTGSWATADTALNATGPTTLTIGGVDVPLAAGQTLTDAVTAINESTAGVTAVAVDTGSGFRLQLTSQKSGAGGVFTVSGDVPVATLSSGTDAKLRVGDATAGYDVTSPTNTFTDVLPGTTFTVSKKDAAATVTVSKDPDATAAKVQTLVDAANALQSAITSYTDPKSSSATLKGDTTLRALSNRIAGVVSYAVGGVSASTVGIQLNRDGTFAFDKTVFTGALTADPAKVQKVFAESKVTSTGADGVSGNADDVSSPIGLAAQLEALAKGASDTTTGSLVLLATSEDAQAKDLQARIDAWDTRLALREQTITRQFTAMETALSTMQNQASWLSSQIAGLPSWSSSSK